MIIRRKMHIVTRYIKLNNSLCKACWKCVDSCHGNVIGKVDLLFHKHAHIDDPENCKGCLQCVKACPQHAITEYRITNKKLSGAIS